MVTIWRYASLILREKLAYLIENENLVEAVVL